MSDEAIPIEEFCLDAIDDQNSRLAHRGNLAVSSVQGTVLENQFKTRLGYVLFVTLDCPFEESLFIYYLDHSFAIRDYVTLGCTYRSGILRNVRLKPNAVAFSFFYPDDDWVVEIKENRIGKPFS